MDLTQQLLQVSAKLYQHLTNLPKEEMRDEFIEEINRLLGERGDIINQLKNAGFQFNNLNKTHVMLEELDKGIRERLKKVLDAIKTDLRELQNTKKNERQYMNPYSNIQVMDGRYYDKKK